MASNPGYFVLDLPHSDACFVKAYPAETTEAFCDGHVSAFSFLGGVPRSILYDNTRLAVARILGDGRRQRTRVFSELVSHQHARLTGGFGTSRYLLPARHIYAVLEAIGVTT